MSLVGQNSARKITRFIAFYALFTGRSEAAELANRFIIEIPTAVLAGPASAMLLLSGDDISHGAVEPISGRSCFLPCCKTLCDDDVRRLLFRFTNLLQQIAVPIRAHRFTANQRSESVHQQEFNAHEFRSLHLRGTVAQELRSLP